MHLLAAGRSLISAERLERNDAIPEGALIEPVGKLETSRLQMPHRAHCKPAVHVRVGWETKCQWLLDARCLDRAVKL